MQLSCLTQQLEVSEEKAMAREENYQKQIRELLNRWVATLHFMLLSHSIFCRHQIYIAH